MKTQLLRVILGQTALLSTLLAIDIYVGPEGDDAFPGTLQKPLSSLSAARDKIKAMNKDEAITVHLSDGVYYLPEALVFTPEDSGRKEAPILYKAVNEGGAILSGGAELHLDWEPYEGGVFQARTPAGIKIDQLFINGQNQRMARYPNYDASKKTEAYQGFAADAFSKKRAASWADPEGGYIHAMHDKRWGGYHYLITGKDAKGEVTYEGGWQNNRQMGMHKAYRMVENIFEELDAPNEWYHNAKTSTLYYMPQSPEELKSAKVEVVNLSQLIEFKGSIDDPVRYINLQGLVVRHAARTFMETKEPLLRSDWTIYRGGAFFLTGTENISIMDCEFDQVGGNAIFVSNYNRHTLVKGCHIHDAGASGVCFVGDPGAVYNPLFEYAEKNELSEISRIKGPKTENYPALGTVEDCLIHKIGRVERQPAGVQIEMAMEITVRDCSIYDTARSGINVSSGAWGGHLIERCDVFDTVLETHDHGSFNSWGRDRFWRTHGAPDWQTETELQYLDAMKTTVIRNNRWRCDHGWDVDLDDGSTNYDIYNNLMLAGGLKLREGFRRRVWNNILINNTFHPHVWYTNSEDEVYSNIMMAKYRGVSVPAKPRTGKRIDRNLIFGGELTQEFGWDENSVVADPLFVDPKRGNYQVRAGSPAFDIGFVNFPMDQFGVKKPSLKTIARTPEFPKLGDVPRDIRGENRARKEAAAFKDMPWLGVVLHPLVGEEYSAYGVSKETGGLAIIKANSGSSAIAQGLRVGDLIQELNGKRVSHTSNFKTELSRTASKPIKLKIIREQQAIEITLEKNFNH